MRLPAGAEALRQPCIPGRVREGGGRWRTVILGRAPAGIEEAAGEAEAVVERVGRTRLRDRRGDGVGKLDGDGGYSGKWEA